MNSDNRHTTKNRLRFTGNLSTTAMGIMPHDSIDAALEAALALDIPFWPQLPKVSFQEDMYVQAIQNFPGAVIDETNRHVYVDSERFMDELPAYLENETSPDLYRLSADLSPIYRRFLSFDLSEYKAIRGQIMSPVSIGLTITDEHKRPIAYHDEMRELLFSFIQKKTNMQYTELSEKNPNAFVWLDDPGLQFVFSGMCGYDSTKARTDLVDFLNGIDGPRGLHLCGNPDWDFLFFLPLEIISFNAYAYGDVAVSYESVKSFIEKGNIVSWGIVPTMTEEFTKEDVESITSRLLIMWRILENKGVSREVLVRNSIIAPAACNLMNPDGTATVENAFRLLGEVSKSIAEASQPG
jgi:hypothetical protein